MKKRIILASGSPRRAEILTARGVNFTVLTSDADEKVEKGTDPKTVCMYLALKKALAVRRKTEEGLIIAADTIVVSDGQIIGKPAGEGDAFETLKKLRNGSHSVMTGVALCDAGEENTRVFCEETHVFFRDYTDEDILAYIRTGEPMDKAGSYAIQGGWAEFVERIEGDYSNVVGLPWDRFFLELKRF